MTKTMDNANIDDVKKNVPDVKLQGDPQAWQLVSKASTEREGWMKSTKRMAVDGGFLYQVTSEHQNHNGEIMCCAEALAFVPEPLEAISSYVLSTEGAVLEPNSDNAVKAIHDVTKREQDSRRAVTARFVCDGTDVDECGNRGVLMHAAIDGDGWPEFTKYTPSGDLSMYIDKDAPASTFFEPGEVYEVVFRKAEKR